MSLSMVTVLMRPVCHAKMTKWRMAPARLSHQQTNQLMTVALISFARSSGAAARHAGRRGGRLEREEARHERALHHADVDRLADVHDEAEDLREDVSGGGDVEAADAGAAPPAGC